jgi:hypothetical protein
VKIYTNWLQLISDKKSERFRYAPVGVQRIGNTLQWIE